MTQQKSIFYLFLLYCTIIHLGACSYDEQVNPELSEFPAILQCDESIGSFELWPSSQKSGDGRDFNDRQETMGSPKW